MNPAIAVEELGFSWPGGPELFGGLGFSIAKGESWAVVGSSGSGKSSLLALLAGLERPSAGRITIEGDALDRPRPGTGLVLQDHGLLPWATIRDNVALGPRLRRFYGPDGRHAPTTGLAASPGSRRAARAAVDRWLERLGIAAVGDSWPSRVSGGQRQRAAIARSLVLEPDILLMDEPFAALDEATREDLRGLTLDIVRERRVTLVFVTHSIDEALAVGDRILVLGKGGGPGEPRDGGAAHLVLDNPRGNESVLAALRARLRAALEATP